MNVGGSGPAPQPTKSLCPSGMPVHGDDDDDDDDGRKQNAKALRHPIADIVKFYLAAKQDFCVSGVIAAFSLS